MIYLFLASYVVVLMENSPMLIIKLIPMINTKNMLISEQVNVFLY